MNPAKFCKQEAIYWPPEAQDENGEPTYAANSGEIIKARWDLVEGERRVGVRLQSDFVEGEPVEGESVVMVDQDVEVGGLLMEGGMDEYLELGEDYTPKPTDTGMHVITRFLENPTINAKNFLRRAVIT